MLNTKLPGACPNILLFLRVDEPNFMRKLLLLTAFFCASVAMGQLSADSREMTPVNVALLADEELITGLAEADLFEKTQRVRELIQRKSGEITAVFTDFLPLHNPVEVSIGVQKYETTVSAEMFATLVNEREKAARAAYYAKTNTRGQQRALNGLFGRDYTSLWTVAECEALLLKWAHLAFENPTTPVPTLNVILAEQDFKFPDYKRLSDLCRKNPSPELLAALALHRHKQDQAFIVFQMPVSYLAVSLRPLPEWFGPLSERVDSDFMSPEYQRAVAAYKTREAAVLLTKIADKIIRNEPDKAVRNDHLFTLYSNLETFSCADYRPILKKIDAQLL